MLVVLQAFPERLALVGVGGDNHTQLDLNAT